MKSFDKFLAEIRTCQECKTNPAVLITTKQIPICKRHWRKLAETNWEWGN